MVRSIHVAAFQSEDGVEPVEARLLDQLRTDPGWLTPFSLVAELNGTIVGHGVCTRGYVGETSVLALGPIAVHPTAQRVGVGSAIMLTMIRSADAAKEQLIALLGSPDYYGRFGFEPSTNVAIVAPQVQWGEFFQVLRLASFSPDTNGQFRYAEPFNRL